MPFRLSYDQLTKVAVYGAVLSVTGSAVLYYLIQSKQKFQIFANLKYYGIIGLSYRRDSSESVLHASSAGIEAGPTCLQVAWWTNQISVFKP